MYPLAVLLPIIAIRRDVRAWIYPFVLAVGALPISIYHVLIERFPSLETGACDVNNPCSTVWMRHFGFVTIPFMAASAFAAIATAIWLAAHTSPKGTPSCLPETASPKRAADSNNNNDASSELLSSSSRSRRW
jgi:disulfide bond formation protein DsbB